MKGNNIPQMRKKKKEKTETEIKYIYRKPFLLEIASYLAQTRNTSKKKSSIKHGKFRPPETSEGR